MKFFVALVFLVISVYSTSSEDPRNAKVLKYEYDNIGIDGYNFLYQTSDGVSRQEEAEVKNLGTDSESLNVRGSVSYTAADGQKYTLNYIADENGYQPEGSHLPLSVFPIRS